MGFLRTKIEVWLSAAILVSLLVPGLALSAGGLRVAIDERALAQSNDTPNGHPSPLLASPAPHNVYLPLITSPGATNQCPSIPAESYSTLSVNPPPTDRPAESHPDLNLSIRGYIPTNGTLGLIDITGPTDPGSPQLAGLFVDNRTATFIGNYEVYDWNWGTNSRGAPIVDPPVTLAALKATPGEKIRVPNSGYNIGNALLVPQPGTAFRTIGPATTGYSVLVLYAATNRITLKYTRDDNVVRGYTIHIEQVCVEPRLLALYEQMNLAGRGRLPALYSGQAIGTSILEGIGVAPRDTGSFMDPRSRKDWWKGR